MKYVIADLLPILTLLADIAIIAFLLLLLLKKKSSAVKFFRTHALKIAVVVSWAAMLGSLFYSEIMGFTPCTLCWYQRIAIYPLSILSIIALKNPHKSIVQALMTLSIIGGIIATYHYITQLVGLSTVCGFGVDCATKYTFAFGYITIPVMAMTASAVVLIVTLLKIRK